MGLKEDEEVKNAGKTSEQRQYGTGWETCKLCGINDKGVKGDACVDAGRCSRVREGLPLGPPMVLSGPLVRYELDESEEESVINAVVRQYLMRDWDEAIEEDAQHLTPEGEEPPP